MTDKRILIETKDMDVIPDSIGERFEKDVKAIFYSKDYLRITEIDLDEGTVKDIPITEKGKIIFTLKKDGVNFDYEVKEE